MEMLMGNERLHYRSPNINVCFKATIKGDLGEVQFSNAITDVCKKHPILTCVLKTDENSNVWYVKDKTVPSIEFYENIEWLSWYNDEDAKPFDFTNGPLVKFCIIRNTDSIDIVVLGHHIIADGIGYLNLLRDFLLALDQKLDTTPNEYNSAKGLKGKSKLGFLASAFAKKLNNSWQAMPKHFTDEEYLVFFHSYRKVNKSGMLLQTFDSSELNKLVLRCKELGITVNEAISTAFVRALFESGFYKSDKVKLGVAASIRNEMVMPTPNAMGNYTTGISVTVNNSNKSFTENAKVVKKLLSQKLTVPKNRYQVINFLDLLDKSFLDAVPFAAYGRFENSSAKKLAEILGETSDNKGIGISNLGVQSLGEFYSFTIADVLFVPPVFPANLINVGVITGVQILHFCIRYSKADISESEIDNICLGVKKHLFL